MKQYSRALSFSRYTHLWGSLQLSRINKAPKMTQFDQNASIPLPQRIPKAFWLYGRKFHTLAENAQKIVFPVLKLKNHSDTSPRRVFELFKSRRNKIQVVWGTPADRTNFSGQITADLPCFGKDPYQNKANQP